MKPESSSRAGLSPGGCALHRGLLPGSPDNRISLGTTRAFSSARNYLGRKPQKHSVLQRAGFGADWGRSMTVCVTPGQVSFMHHNRNGEPSSRVICKLRTETHINGYKIKNGNFISYTEKIKENTVAGPNIHTHTHTPPSRAECC